MGFLDFLFKKKPKADEPAKASSDSAPQRKHSRKVIIAGKRDSDRLPPAKPAVPPPVPAASATVATIPPPAKPDTGFSLASKQRPPSERPKSREPIIASAPPEFTGDLSAVSKPKQSNGGTRTGDAALLEFLRLSVDGKPSLITYEQEVEIKALAASEDLPIDVAAVRIGALTEDQLVNALTQKCWVPHLKVDKYEIRKKALDTIAREDASFYGVFPVDKLGSLLTLAMVNPLDTEAIRVLQGKTGLDIKTVVATRSEILQGIDKYYGGKVQAKENSLSFAQDVEPTSVTSMMAKVTRSSGPHQVRTPLPAPAMQRGQTDIAPEFAPEIQDIDDILAGDEVIAPAIIEPIALKIEAEPELVETAAEPTGLESAQVPKAPAAAAPEAPLEIEVPEPVIAPPRPAFRIPPTPAPVQVEQISLEETAAIIPPPPVPKPSKTGEFEFSLEDAAANAGSGALERTPSHSSIAPEFDGPATPATAPKAPAKPAPALVEAQPAPVPPVQTAPVQPAAPMAPAAPKAVVAAAPVAPAAPARHPLPASGPAPATARPATASFTSQSTPASAQPAGVNLVPVTEDEFQHAISHGKSHMFDKWVGLQTRNRIINAVVLDPEIDKLLAPAFTEPRKVA